MVHATNNAVRSQYQGAADETVRSNARVYNSEQKNASWKSLTNNGHWAVPEMCQATEGLSMHTRSRIASDLKASRSTDERYKL